MDVFVSIENHFASVGLTASQSLQANRFNVKNACILLIFLLNIILCVAYIFHGANNFNECIDSLFGCFTLIDAAIAFVHFIWQMPKLFRFIDEMETTFNQRKCLELNLQFLYPFYFKNVSGLVDPQAKGIYEKIDRILQKWFKILNLVLVNVTPACVILPTLIACLFMYFNTELGNTAFVLPFPMW